MRSRTPDREMTEDWASRAPWDERVRFLASQLRALARSYPPLATEARQLAHSIEELAGLEGLVSEDYVSVLFSRARGLASLVQRDSDVPRSSARTPSAVRTVRAPVSPEAPDEDDVQTSPGTPSALRRVRAPGSPSTAVTAPPPSGFDAALVENDSDLQPRAEEPPGSGLRRVLGVRKDTSLRLRTG